MMGIRSERLTKLEQSVPLQAYLDDILQGRFHLGRLTQKPNQRFSWLSNKMLKSREEVYPWIKLKVGNGVSCRFWEDNWSSLGRLSSFLGMEGPRQVGITRDARLADLWRQGAWSLPPARSEKQVTIQLQLTLIQLSSETDDVYEWWIDDVIKQKHNTGSIYAGLRERLPSVPWHGIVWTSRGIPKHRFLTWLFVLNRCPTRDHESRDHLLFQCPYSWEIWTSICHRCSHTPHRTWSDTIADLCNFSGNRHKKHLLMIAWQATIYTIWLERNNRLHKNNYKSAPLIIRKIDLLVRNRASSFRDSNPSFSSSLLQLWFNGDGNP
ncbi:unnamed protein product [Thlaspi arvense]|uniref:Reverse transcriptase zinc-binding domain-containing protein n=1 Tax=Thlaspi arvense TaxID=13288 RepID=A0AAU9RZ53_THLAR|nr:unnamed protein product [Thlaspi arvense]